MTTQDKKIASLEPSLQAAGAEPHVTIAFQGVPGAYSHMACRINYPEMIPLACDTFENAFAAVHEKRARYAMIPIDNTLAGRVADVHHLLPRAGLHIVSEHFLRVNHQLLALPGASMETIRTVETHVHAMGQCRDFIRKHGLKSRVVADTAGAAADVAVSGDLTKAAIASRLAAQIYGLEIIRPDIEDAEHNTTRFVALAGEPRWPAVREVPTITTFCFRVRNRPAALFKALSGFATNGVNMLKLESYIDHGFAQAQFYADILGHPDEDGVRFAFEELRFFSNHVEILGVYPAAPARERFS